MDVTVMRPVAAPTGTVAETVESFGTVKLTGPPLSAADVVPVK